MQGGTCSDWSDARHATQMKRKAAQTLQKRMQRRAGALVSEANATLAACDGPLAADQVHRLRVICKQLRATWQLLTPALGRRWTRPRERALRDAARILAGPREAHVLGRTVIRLTRRHGDVPLAGAQGAAVLAPVDAMEQLLDVIHERWPERVPPVPATRVLQETFVAQSEAVEAWPEHIEGELLAAGLLRSYRRARRAGRRAMRASAVAPALAAPAGLRQDRSAIGALRNAAGETLAPTPAPAASGTLASGVLHTAAGEEMAATGAPAGVPGTFSEADPAGAADEAWHECRRWAKYELYQLALLARHARPAPRQRRLERFGERLGRFHDLCDLRALAEASVGRLAEAGALPGIEQVLALEEAPLRRHLRRGFRSLYARPAGARRRRLERHLRRQAGSS